MRSGRINIRITNAVGALIDITPGFNLILVVWQIPRVKEMLKNVLTTYVPKSFKILINSGNAISGNQKDGMYKVNLPLDDTDKHKIWQYGVETFCIETNDPLILPSTLLLDIPSITQRDSYSTLSGNPNTVMMTMKSGVFYNNIFDFSQLGMPLNSIQQFVNGQINIRLLNNDGVVSADIGANCVWSLLLTIWEMPGPNAISNPG
jgi:hypothetical protein